MLGRWAGYALLRSIWTAILCSSRVRYELASHWLREAEKLADLEPQPPTLWYAYRRLWASARKHLPVKDVAAAGGWKTTHVLQEIYQQPDDETLLRIVTGGAELRSTGRNGARG